MLFGIHQLREPHILVCLSLCASGGPSSSLRSPQVQVPLTTREGIHDEEELESIGSEGPATTTSGNTSSRARLLASRLNREGLGGSPLHSTTELEADVNKQDWRR